MNPDNFPGVDADLAAFDAAVARMREEFSRLPGDHRDKEWVKRKLRHMVDVDQYMRKLAGELERKYSREETAYFWEKFGRRVYLIDKANMGDLKELLALYGWFRISEFGPDADLHAWLLTQHADDDLPFQKEVLLKLEALYPAGESDPSNYAYLFDRVATNEGRLQKYGTQWQRVGPGKFEPEPIEDPANVDERRKSVGLGTLEEYGKGFV